jgi:predicted Rossmann fold nucleotide-binding protein DprA/Smf involved in DNA uptake
MIFAVVGSRSFRNYEFLATQLKKYPIEAIVSGGANGADALANRYARKHNIEIREILPDWGKHGKSAGPIRNKQIVQACSEIIVFWDGKSPGTRSTINFAKLSGKPVHIYWI